MHALPAEADADRYLPLPRFGIDAQREIARAWAEGLAPEPRAALLAALDADPGLRALRDAADAHRVREAWTHARIRAVVDRVFA